MSNEHSHLVLGIVASVILAMLAFFFSIIMAATLPVPEAETMFIPTWTLVPEEEIDVLSEQFKKDGIVPRCQDLPLTTDGYAQVIPIVCLLEVSK